MIIRNRFISKKEYAILFAGLAVVLGLLAGVYAGQTPNLLQAIALIVGVLIVILVFSDLDIGLIILVALNYLQVSQNAIVYYGAPPIALPFTLLLILAIIIRWILTRQAPKGLTVPIILLGTYGIVIFMSMFAAADFSKAIESVTGFVGNSIVAVTVIAMMQNAKSFRSVIWALIECGIVVGTLNVFQFFTGTFDNFYLTLAQSTADMQIVGDYSADRIGGPIGDPNYFAEILMIIIPLAFYQVWAEKSLVLKSLSAYSAFICTLALVFTYSRGGFLALAVVVVITLFIRTPRLGETLLLAAIVIFSLRFVPSKYTERLLTMVDLFTSKIDIREEGSFRGRAGALASAWNMFLDHPFFGVGIDNFTDRYPEYASRLGIVTTTTESNSTHSLYLEIAAETGIAGLMSFGAILVVVSLGIRKSLKIFKRIGRQDLWNSAIGVGFALLGYFTAAIFIHGSYPRYLWLIIGIGMSVPVVARNMLAQSILEEEENTSLKIFRYRHDNYRVKNNDEEKAN